MAELGIVSGSEINSPAGGAPMNPQAFRDAALAPGKIAEALGNGVGGIFEDVSDRILAARNSKAIFDADATMRGAKDQFLNDLHTDPRLASDPATWVPEIQNRVQNTQQQILDNPTLAPVVKRQLVQTTGLWGMSTTSEVRNQALSREMADTLKAGENSATAALANSTPDDKGQGVATAVQVYQNLNKHGLIGPQELAQKTAMAPVIAAESQVNNIIATDPINAPDKIKNNYASVLPDLKLRVALRVAFQAQASEQARNEQGWDAKITDDPTHTVDQDALKNDRDTKQITSAGYDKIMARQTAFAKADTMAQSKQEQDELAVAKLNADEVPTDGKSWGTYEQTMKAQGLNWTNPARVLALNNYVDQKIKAGKNQAQREENPVERQTYDLMDEDRKQQGTFVPTSAQTVSHLFGPDETKVQRYSGTLEELRGNSDQQMAQQFGPDATKESVLAAEQLNYAKKKDAMRQWFSGEEAAGRKPTMEQAQEARMRIEAPDVQASVVHSLTQGASGTSGTIRVKAKDGTTGTIPASNLQKALAAGYTQLQ